MESPRNSRRSLFGMPPCSYAYERWVSASSRSSGSISTPSFSMSAVRSMFSPTITRRSDVGDLAALVLHEQGGACGVLDDLGAVRQAVGDLAVLDGLDERGELGFPLGPTGVRVGARLLPLRNSHDYLSSLLLLVDSVVSEAWKAASADQRESMVSRASRSGTSASRSPVSGSSPGQSGRHTG